MQFNSGEREIALSNMRESVRLLRDMGAAVAVQVEQTLRQMEAAHAGTSAPQAMSPLQLASALISAVVRALRGDMPRDGLRAELAQLDLDGALHALVAALLGIIDGNAGATNDLRDAVQSLIDDASEREELVQLSVALFNLARTLADAGEPAAAVSLLAQVVALDERTGHPDLASDRAALEQMRARASGQPAPGLRDVIAAWRDGARDEKQFVALLDAVCNLFVAAMRDGSTAQRNALAEDLAQLRAARPLPVAGANDFLHVLQLHLRGEPAMLTRAAQIAATLPMPLREALDTLERMLRGEAPEEADEDHVTADDAQLAAMLDAMPPAQRAQVAVLSQVAPILQAGVDVLRHRAATAAERVRHAERLDSAAAQVAGLAAQQPDVPWSDAAGALRAVAAWLRDAPVDLAALPAPYDALVRGMLEEADE